MARVEAKSGVRLFVDDPAFDRRAIGVHVEDGKENADAFLPGLHNFGFIDLDNVRHRSVRRGDDRVRVLRGNALRIAEEPKNVNGQDQDEQKKPREKERARQRQQGEDDEDPARFVESLRTHE